MRLLYRSILVCLFVALCYPALAPAAYAAGPAFWEGVWNKSPLRVTVIPRGHTIPDDVKQSKPWWQWGNTSTDAYIFDLLPEQGVDLIIDFAPQAGHPQATLYVLPTNQRKNVQINEATYILPKFTQPQMILWPRQGDWLVAGQANFDLELREINRLTGAYTRKASIGAELPGVPRWATSTLLEDPRSGDGINRFGARVRSDSSVPYELATPLLPSWPYLSVLVREPLYGKNQPLFFDPRATVREIVQTWVGFETAGMYQFNSNWYAPKTDFEAPFAWYRFDPAAGRSPNLVVRTDIFPKDDPFGPPLRRLQRTAVRMSWTEKAAGRWRYSLTVSGSHVMAEQTRVGDTLVQAPSYEQLPSWVASKPWKAITFVEATLGTTGSEGIYEYSVEDNYAVDQWINGRQSQPPASFHAPYLRYPNIDPNRLADGFRGEYSMVYNRVPQIYVAPMDNRLHLLYAKEGIWNLGSGEILRTYNLGDGPYVNAWTREQVPVDSAAQQQTALPGELEQSLYTLSGYILYSGPDGIELRRAQYSPSSLEIPPPTGKASWQALQDRVGPLTAQAMDPGNLHNWLSRFAGQSMQVAGAEMSQVRAISGGFRFVLTLRPGFQPVGDNLLNLNKLVSGQYVVTYNGAFTVAPLTPPALSATLKGGSLKQLETTALQLALRNDGLQDLPQATLELLGTSPRGRATVITTQTLSLLAQTTITPTINWTITSPGTWTVTPRILPPEGPPIMFAPVQFHVLPAQDFGTRELLTASVLPTTIPFILLGLAGFALLAGLAFWVQWNTFKQVSDAT